MKLQVTFPSREKNARNIVFVDSQWDNRLSGIQQIAHFHIKVSLYADYV